MKTRDRQLGFATAMVLQAIRRGNRFGFDIIDATGLASGTVYPTLGRMEKREYLTAQWEDRSLADQERRPRRRYYELTSSGQEALDTALHRFGMLAGAPGGETSFASGDGE